MTFKKIIIKINSSIITYFLCFIPTKYQLPYLKLSDSLKIVPIG